MSASLLPLPDDPRLALYVESWPDHPYWQRPFPRSHWLRLFEDVLREFYPQANSASLKLTARHAAPFPLAVGPNVP